MKGGKQPHGFTIIEALIFLIVSGMLLTSALLLISGKEGDTEFNVGIRQVENNIQDLVSNVSTGYYNRASNIKCTTTGYPIPTAMTIVLKASNTGGADIGCQYLGEVIQFGPSGNSSEYIVYPVAGLEYSNLESLTPVTDITQSLPQPIIPDIQTVPMPNNITVATVNGTNNPAALGFFLDAATNPLSTANPLSSGENGNNTVSLWPIDDDINDTEGIVESKIEAPTAVNWELTNVNPIAGEAICFNSGSNADSGIITIGGNGNPTNVDLSIQSHPCP